MWGVVGRRIVLAGAVVLVTAGCNASLPEPDSPAAQLYRSRCGTCHRLYSPHVLKYEMWKLTVQRMQGEMARKGFPPLSAEESTLLLDYLRRHAG